SVHFWLRISLAKSFLNDCLELFSVHARKDSLLLCRGWQENHPRTLKDVNSLLLCGLERERDLAKGRPPCKRQRVHILINGPPCPVGLIPGHEVDGLDYRDSWHRLHPGFKGVLIGCLCFGRIWAERLQLGYGGVKLGIFQSDVVFAAWHSLPVGRD